MTARIIDGRCVADQLRQETARVVGELAADDIEVRLDAVMVGDPSSAAIYTKRQAAQCAEVGIHYHLHTLAADSTETEIRAHIQRLNDDPAVTGIILNLPLPPNVDTPAMQYSIDPYKDVEGVNPANVGLLFYDCPIIAPCTALGVMEILKRLDCCVKGMNAVVVGQGAVAGRPITLFLAHKLATVTACHAATRDLAMHTRSAELLIVAAGRPHLIGPEHVKPGAIVIDVGINAVPVDFKRGEHPCTCEAPKVDTSAAKTQAGGGSAPATRLVGDVDFDEVKEVAGAITPVPGGVGPITVAMLLRSTAEAARRQAGPRRLPP